VPPPNNLKQSAPVDAVASASDSCVRNARGEWTPANSVKATPLFEWPPRPFRWLKWLLSYPGFLWPWNGIYLLITILIWRYLQPPVSHCVELKAGWMGLLFLRNLGLAWAVYGGWHLLLYIFKLQGTERKYDIRWPSRNDPKFLFHNQTLDNIFWSCASGVTIWTAYEVLYFWALANKKIPYVDWRVHPVYCLVWMCAIPFWRDIHFYFVHRLIHWGPLYRWAHSVHHRNTNPGPWSGLSMHPIEHLLYFSSVLIHFVVPSHPVHFLFNSEQTGAFAPATGHHGFEKPLAEKTLPSGSYFHYVHHRIFTVNFGGEELPLDRWFGTYRRYLSGDAETKPAAAAPQGAAACPAKDQP
jgi:sterol desaturase/sphingolipid hydroxylase (fatty acid hydroxylase superfamily)